MATRIMQGFVVWRHSARSVDLSLGDRACRVLHHLQGKKPKFLPPVTLLGVGGVYAGIMYLGHQEIKSNPSVLPKEISVEETSETVKKMAIMGAATATQLAVFMPPRVAIENLQCGGKTQLRQFSNNLTPQRLYPGGMFCLLSAMATRSLDVAVMNYTKQIPVESEFSKMLLGLCGVVSIRAIMNPVERSKSIGFILGSGSKNMMREMLVNWRKGYQGVGASVVAGVLGSVPWWTTVRYFELQYHKPLEKFTFGENMSCAIAATSISELASNPAKVLRSITYNQAGSSVSSWRDVLIKDGLSPFLFRGFIPRTVLGTLQTAFCFGMYSLFHKFNMESLNTYFSNKESFDPRELLSEIEC